MNEYKNIEFQIKQYQMLEAKGELTEYAQGKLNGMLEVMNLAKNNEDLGSVMLNSSEKGTLHFLHKAERDIHPEQEKALAKLTNEDLLKIAEDYKNKD